MGTGTQGVTRDVARALEVLGRAARARLGPVPVSTTNAPRRESELRLALDALAGRSGSLPLDLEATHFLFRDQRVEEASPSESLAPHLYGDGVRRIEVLPGIDVTEVDLLVAACARALGYSGLGEDAASFLSHQELPHVRLTLAEAEGPTKEELEAILGETFGEGYGLLPARTVLERVSGPAGAASECQPVRSLYLKPSYGAELLEELSREGDRGAAQRALEALLAAAQVPLHELDATALGTALVARYDAALAGHDLLTAARLLEALREVSAPEHRVAAWLDAATNETHVRQALASHRAAPTAEATDGLLRMLRAIGPRATPLVLGSIPGTVDAEARRRLAQLALELGIDDLARVKELLRSDQPHVIAEAIFVLVSLGTREAQGALADLESDARYEARVALAGELRALDEDRATEIATRLLDDQSSKVRVAAARALAEIGGFGAAKSLDAKVQRLEADDDPMEVKLAVLESYAITNASTALRYLTALTAKAEGLLVKDHVEELAVAAVEAMGKLPTQRSVGILKKLVAARNKRVRETARDVLVRLKEGSA